MIVCKRRWDSIKFETSDTSNYSCTLIRNGVVVCFYFHHRDRGDDDYVYHRSPGQAYRRAKKMFYKHIHKTYVEFKNDTYIQRNKKP